MGDLIAETSIKPNQASYEGGMYTMKSDACKKRDAAGTAPFSVQCTWD